MKVPPLTDFGKSCNELLYGSPKTGGVYQYDNRCRISSKSRDGLSVELTAVKGEDRGDGESRGVDLDVKATLAVCKGLTFESVATSASKASLKATAVDFLVPGTKGVASCAYPYVRPAKVSMEYGHQHFHIKGTTELQSQPQLELSAAAGLYGAVVGGQVKHDTSGKQCLDWSVAAGYTTHDNHSVFGYVLQKGKELKMSYAHKMSHNDVCGVEIIKPLNKNGDMITSIGYSRMLASGALIKAKATSMGICSVLWEGTLEGRAKLALSGQIDAHKLEAPPRLGWSVDFGK